MHAFMHLDLQKSFAWNNTHLCEQACLAATKRRDHTGEGFLPPIALDELDRTKHLVHELDPRIRCTNNRLARASGEGAEGILRWKNDQEETEACRSEREETQSSKKVRSIRA